MRQIAFLLVVAVVLVIPVGYSRENCPDPNAREEIPECEHDFPTPGEATTDPAATVALYYQNATDKIPDDHIIERILNGDDANLTTSVSFSSGIAPPDADGCTWIADGGEEMVKEKYEWTPDGGSESSATFSPNSKGKRTITVTYERLVKQKYRVTVYCTKCGASDEILKTVSAHAAASDSVPYDVYALKIKVRNAAIGGEYSDSATIAAGPYSSPIHRADVLFSLDPAGPSKSSLTFPLTLTGGHGAKSNPHNASVGRAIPDGDHDASIINNVDSNGNGSGSISMNTTVHAKMSPSNVGTRTAVLSSPSAVESASVTFEWAEAPEWDYSPTFRECEYEAVSMKNLKVEDVALENHQIWFLPLSVGVYSIEYDWDSWEYEWTYETVNRTLSDDLSMYTFFANEEGGSPDGHVTVDGTGTATAYQYVCADWFWIVDDVHFKMGDKDSFME